MKSHTQGIYVDCWLLNILLKTTTTYTRSLPHSDVPCMCVLSCVWLLATSWTIAHQVPLSVAFPRQEYWRRLLFPPPGDLPDSGIKPESPASPVLRGIFFTTEPPGNPHSDVLGFNSKFLKEKSTNIKNVYIIYPFTTRSRCYCRLLRE